MELTLAQAMDSLRSELAEAQDSGVGHQFRFKVSEVEVSLAVEFRNEVGGKIGLAVIPVEVNGRVAGASTHTVKIKMSVLDAALGNAPVEISGVRPGNAN